MSRPGNGRCNAPGCNAIPKGDRRRCAEHRYTPLDRQRWHSPGPRAKPEPPGKPFVPPAWMSDPGLLPKKPPTAGG